MTSLVEQIAAIEASLSKLQKRVDGLPVMEIMVSRLLINLGREINGRLDQRLLPSGLTEAEFKALVSLHSFPDGTANPSDLCTGGGLSPANVTRLTDTLVERGLILRIPDENDRRRLVLQVTPQGLALMKKLMPVMTHGARETYRDFSKMELKQLLASLRQLAVTLDSLNAEHAPEHKS